MVNNIEQKYPVTLPDLYKKARVLKAEGVLGFVDLISTKISPPIQFTPDIKESLNGELIEAVQLILAPTEAVFEQGKLDILARDLGYGIVSLRERGIGGRINYSKNDTESGIRTGRLRFTEMVRIKRVTTTTQWISRDKEMERRIASDLKEQREIKKTYQYRNTDLKVFPNIAVAQTYSEFLKAIAREPKINFRISVFTELENFVRDRFLRNPELLIPLLELAHLPSDNEKRKTELIEQLTSLNGFLDLENI